jgi:hypothetical protein
LLFYRDKTKSYKIQAMLQIAFIRESRESNQALAKGIWMQKYCGRCHKTRQERR